MVLNQFLVLTISKNRKNIVLTKDRSRVVYMQIRNESPSMSQIKQYEGVR
jgi:hypothetical protein